MDFKTRYFYEMYKDSCIMKHKMFIHNFIKKHGNNTGVNFRLMFIAIEKYQIKKYGYIIPPSDVEIFVNTDSERVKHFARIAGRFGTVEERKKRKNEYRSTEESTKKILSEE